MTYDPNSPEGIAWRRKFFPCVIYALIDPRSNHVRYIGQALNMESRLRMHLNDARCHRSNANAAKNEWLRGLMAEGLVPTVTILHESNDVDAPALEKEAIVLYASQGWDLFNVRFNPKRKRA